MFIFASMNTNKIMDEIGSEISPEINAQAEMSVAIVNRINDILRSEKMTQKDLARLMGKTETEVSRWLSGTHNLTVATLCKISAALGKEVLHVADYELDDVHSVEGRDIVYEKKLFNKYHKKFVDTYKNRMKRIKKEEKRFRRDDKYHNKISGHHIVYKLVVNPNALEEDDQTRILNKEKTRGYEFLIEFDVNKPSYGIYYGCRGLIFGKQTQEIENFQKEWNNTLRKKVVEVLNNTFPHKSFDELCLLTDNANNKTYWPFWIRLSEDEDIIKVACLAVRLIYNVYKQYLNDPSSESLVVHESIGDAIEQKNINTYTSYTKDAFDRLFEGWPKTKEIVKLILEKAEDIDLINKNEFYDFAWNYNNEKFKFKTSIKFFLEKIYKDIVSPYIEDDKKSNNVSSKEKRIFISKKWTLFTPFILSYDGRPLKSLKQASKIRGKLKQDPYLEYIKTLQEYLKTAKLN